MCCVESATPLLDSGREMGITSPVGRSRGRFWRSLLPRSPSSSAETSRRVGRRISTVTISRRATLVDLRTGTPPVAGAPGRKPRLESRSEPAPSRFVTRRGFRYRYPNRQALLSYVSFVGEKNSRMDIDFRESKTDFLQFFIEPAAAGLLF